MRTKKIPRKEREQIRRRREILDAAGHLFSTRGYADVSIKEIAAEAECAVGTLYKFFASKEAVYTALIEDFLDRGLDELTRAVDTASDASELLRRWIGIKQRLFRENLPLIRLIHCEVGLGGAGGSTGLGPGIQARHDASIARLEQVFAAGIAAGRFAAIAPPRMLALALDSLTTTLLVDVLEAPARADETMDTTPLLDPDAILRIFFEGLLTT